MPNWVENTLTIEGPAEHVEAFVKTAEGVDPQYKQSTRFPSSPEDEAKAKEVNPLCFHKLLPVPQKYLDMTYGGEEEKNADDCGYNWEVQHYGCKWGASNVEVDDSSNENTGYVRYRFSSAWSPPIELLKAISPSWPTLEFNLMYREESMNFEGRFIIKNGQVIKDVKRDVI